MVAASAFVQPLATGVFCEIVSGVGKAASAAAAVAAGGTASGPRDERVGSGLLIWWIRFGRGTLLPSESISSRKPLRSKPSCNASGHASRSSKRRARTSLNRLERDGDLRKESLSAFRSPRPVAAAQSFQARTRCAALTRSASTPSRRCQPMPDLV